MSLMKLEKVPDSTYDMCGGVDEQVREVREVIELPFKHPELFDALGVPQPKVPSSSSPAMLSRVCSSMDLPAQERPSWLVLLLITQIVPSSVSLALSWFRSTLVKVLVWSVNYSSWPGMPSTRSSHDLLLVSMSPA